MDEQQSLGKAFELSDIQIRSAFICHSPDNMVVIPSGAKIIWQTGRTLLPATREQVSAYFDREAVRRRFQQALERSRQQETSQKS
jgi:hypothetical protein